MRRDPELLSEINMTVEFHNTVLNTRREISIPPGLTWEQVVEYSDKFRGVNEVLSNTFRYT